MKKAAALIALTVAVPLLLGAKGCAPPSSPSGGGQVQEAPAQAPGKCVITLTVEHVLSEVIGTMKFNCTGAAVLTVTMLLRYEDSSGDVESLAKDTVNSALHASPAVVSAPCRTGKWWLRVVGEVMGAGATLRIGSHSSKVTDVIC